MTTVVISSTRWRAGAMVAVAAILSVILSLRLDALSDVALIGLGVAVGGIVVLLTAAAVVPRADLFGPFFFYPLFFVIYFGIGSINLGVVRGLVEVNSVAPYMVLGMACYFGGAFLGRLSVANSGRPGDYSIDSREPSQVWRWAALGVMLLALTGWCVQALFYGLPIFGGASRFATRGYLLLLVRLGWVAALLRFIPMVLKRKFPLPVLAGWFGTSAFLCATLAFRTPMLMLALTVLVVTYYGTSVGGTRILLSLCLLAAIMSGLWVLRRGGLEEGETSYGDLLSRFDVPAELGAVAPIWMQFREGTGLFAQAVEKRMAGVTGGYLLVSDAVTALPGKQAAGGEIVRDLFGGTGEGGLTPSILGAMYLDFGAIGIAVSLAGLGFILGLIHRLTVRTGDIGLLLMYAYVLAVAVHWTHRGVFSVSYVFNFIVLGLVVLAARSSTGCASSGKTSRTGCTVVTGD